MSIKQLILTTGGLMLLPTLLTANDLKQATNIGTDQTALGTVQDHQGNRYKTVQIGEQVWLAENLKSTQFQDGSSVTSGFIPEDKQANLEKYGRLYNWHDVNDKRNLCPKGWRVASDDDWKQLEQTIGMSEAEIHQQGWRGGEQDLGVQLKAQQADGLFNKFEQSKINRYQFNARPAGVKWNGFYITQGAYSEFWTASSANAKEAFIRTLAYSWWNAHKGEIRRATSNKDYMFSVRCVKI